MTAKLQGAVETHHRLGAEESEFLSADELHARFPYISPAMVAATFCRRDGWLSSHEATQGFAKGSEAIFLLDTRAEGIDIDQNGVNAVKTNRGTIKTRQIVNAAGPFAGPVASMVGLELPLEPVRRQKIFVSPQAEIPQDAPMCIDLGREIYWRPAHGGALAAWVDPDEPVADPVEEVATDWDYPAVLLDKLPSLSPFWAGLSEKLGARDIQLSAGYYMYTPDEQPLIGPIDEVPGFFLNCGYWAGVMLAPEAGRRVAALVSGDMNNKDNPLRFSRYAEGAVTQSESFLRGRR
jgi:sarcosine oxidase subunit beta